MARRVLLALLVGAAPLAACAGLLGFDGITDDPAGDSGVGPVVLHDGGEDASSDAGGVSADACQGAACNLVDVAMGDGFACALYRDGRIFCWGKNEHGEVGQPEDAATAPTPTLLRTQADGAALPPFKSMTVGEDFACALGRDDTVYCWGNSNRGQVGIGLSRPASTAPAISVFRPTQVTAAGGPFAAIGAGVAHVCVASSAGGVVCWGNEGEGQLGYRTSTMVCADPSASPEPCVASPGPLISEVKFVQLAGGTFSTCGLDDQGEVICWGSNLAGELGRQADLGRAAPSPGTPIEADPSLRFRRVIAGFSFGCALSTLGELLCWGDNSLRSLGTEVGDGGVVQPIPAHPHPAQGFDPQSGVEDVAAAYWSTCALQNGAVFCWGDNSHGQVMPREVGQGGPCTPNGFSAATTGCVERPTRVAVDADGGAIVRLFGGAYEMCAIIVRDGGAGTLCWGARSLPDVTFP